MDRKKFVSQLAAGATAIGMLQMPLAGWAKSLPKKPLPQDVPPLPIDLVKEFVIAGHGDFPKVQAMLKETPTLFIPNLIGETVITKRQLRVRAMLVTKK